MHILFCLLSIFLGDLSIQEGSLATTWIILLGIMSVIIFKVSVKKITCQLGSGLDWKCCFQGKMDILRLTIATLASSYKKILRLTGGGGGIWKLKRQYVIWWWQKNQVMSEYHSQE